MAFLGTAISVIGGLIKGVRSAAAANTLVPSTIPQVIVNQKPINDTGSSSTTGGEWYKQSWIIPAGIITGIVLALVFIVSLFKSK